MVLTSGPPPQEDPLRTAALALTMTAALAACGTTYDVARPTDADNATARQMFAAERAAGTSAEISDEAGIARAQRVAARVQPVAEAFCREQGVANCTFRVSVDKSTDVANAYQSYENGVPVVKITLPLLRQSRNDDEIAFILGHEFGHHIAGHIDRKQTQALAGAVLGGVIAAATDDRYIAQGMAVGGGVGGLAYSQTYELEADVIGTEIARLAGYDPVKGARFFARPADGGAGGGGLLGFFGTHPPNAERLATVLATERQIETQGGLVRR